MGNASEGAEKYVVGARLGAGLSNLCCGLRGRPAALLPALRKGCAFPMVRATNQPLPRRRKAQPSGGAEGGSKKGRVGPEGQSPSAQRGGGAAPGAGVSR